MILGQLLQKVALNDHDGCSSRSQNEMWQTKKKKKNPATFANVGLKNIYATVNGKRLPRFRYHFGIYLKPGLYSAMRRFRWGFYWIQSKDGLYGIQGKEGSLLITPTEFVELFPVHIIDLHPQPEIFKDVPSTITTEQHLRHLSLLTPSYMQCWYPTEDSSLIVTGSASKWQKNSRVSRVLAAYLESDFVFDYKHLDACRYANKTDGIYTLSA